MFELSWDEPYKIERVTFVPVGKNRYAEIDAEDWEKVENYKWYLLRNPHSNIHYAHAFVYPNGKQKGFYMHRHVMGVTDRRIHVDHANHDGLDNRKSNLRKATPTENMHNQRRLKPKKISPYKGVYYNPYSTTNSRQYRRSKPWDARICVSKKAIYLGVFETKEEAAMAYNEAAIKYFGDFACLNEIKI